MPYALIGEKNGKYTLLGVHESEDAASDAASDFSDDARYDRLHIAEFIESIG